MMGFNADELEVFLLGIFTIAWADRKLQDEEKILIRDMLTEYELTGSLQEKVDHWFETPVSINEVDWTILSDEGRAFLYVSAVRIAAADNVVEAREKTTLSDMAKAMDLSADFVAHANATGCLDPALIS